MSNWKKWENQGAHFNPQKSDAHNKDENWIFCQHFPRLAILFSCQALPTNYWNVDAMTPPADPCSGFNLTEFPRRVRSRSPILLHLGWSCSGVPQEHRGEPKHSLNSLHTLATYFNILAPWHSFDSSQLGVELLHGRTVESRSIRCTMQCTCTPLSHISTSELSG